MERRLADFIGAWTVARQIAQADGGEARFEGSAVWTPAQGGAHHVETGTLFVNAQSFNAERRYRWTEALEIYFDDGRFFHTVPVSGGQAGHWCDPDQYDVSYDFSEWPHWTARWQVRGPRKDYVMLTRYLRVADAAPQQRT